MTTLAFSNARAIGKYWGKGDEIVLSEIDHRPTLIHGSRWQKIKA